MSLWSRQNQFYISDQLLITKTFEIISDKLITRFILIWWVFFKHSPKLIITLIKAKPFCISDQLFINKTFEFFSDNNVKFYQLSNFCRQSWSSCGTKALSGLFIFFNIEKKDCESYGSPVSLDQVWNLCCQTCKKYEWFCLTLLFNKIPVIFWKAIVLFCGGNKSTWENNQPSTRNLETLSYKIADEEDWNTCRNQKSPVSHCQSVVNFF